MKNGIHIYCINLFNARIKTIVSMVLCFFFFGIIICNSQDNLEIESIEKLPIKAFKFSFNKGGNVIIYTDLIDSNEKLFDIKSEDISRFVQLPIIHNNSNNPNKFAHREVEPCDDLRAIQILSEDGKIKKIRPLGNKDYLNVSLSPDETRILFRVSGIGTFITNLNGDIGHEFPGVEFPSWINDKLILYAKIEDDGHQFISSDLYNLNIETGKEVKISESEDEICLFPQISSDSSKIIYNTPQGEIYLINYKLKD